MASYAGSAASSATEEIISYTRGEKELNWDNVKQSAVTVARDTAIDGTIGIVTDRAIPKLKKDWYRYQEEFVKIQSMILQESYM